MKVWVIEYHHPSDGDFNATVWANERDALVAVCKDIKLQTSHWDMSDFDQAAARQDIDVFIQQDQFREAIVRFNDYQSNYNSDYGQWWFVSEKDILNYTGNTPTLPAPAMPFKATTSGATCRKCKYSNEYAYADKADGTYCCRQCATFSSIFGTTP